MTWRQIRDAVIRKYWDDDVHGKHWRLRKDQRKHYGIGMTEQILDEQRKQKT